MKLRNSIYKILFTIALITLIGCNPKKTELTEIQSNTLDSIAIADVPENAPGIATGIVMNGEIVYTKNSGYANLKDSVLINEKSRFNIASNGKQFVALAILSLEDEGKLKLNEDIRKYFPNLYPKIDHEITIANLLNHSSGIRDVYNLWALQGITWWEHTYSNQDAIKMLAKQKELNFLPGEKYSYSNSNYILLAEIVGMASNIGFIDYTNQMFQDLNMPNTFFVDDHTSIEGPISKPYFNFETWFNYDWIWNIHGDGNLFSTLEDQLEYEKILQTKTNDRFTEKILLKSQSLLKDSSIDNYGYGVEFMTHRNIPYKYHGGGTGAWKSITARFEDQNISIITLTNSGKVDPMTQTLNTANVLLNLGFEDDQIKVVPDEEGPYVDIKDILGVYEINGFIWEFVEREGDLYLLRAGRNDTKLIREADNLFQQWNDAPFKQEFTKNEAGEMQVSAYYPRTPNFTLTRKDIDFSGYNYSSINGEYTNQETGVKFSIKHSDKLYYDVISGENKMKAMLLSKDELVINDYGYRIKLGESGNGNIKELFLTFNRIQNVRFNRTSTY